jgi:hypothetical protein
MRLVLADPQELDQSEIRKRRIRGQFQQPPRANRPIEPRALLLAPLIAPDDGRPQNVPVLVENHSPMHLAREADAGDLPRLHAALRQHRPHRLLASFPPIRRVLFGPRRAL